MNSKDLVKRVITSIPLLLLFCFSFYYSFVLIITLMILSLISWIEFQKLINKIFKDKFFILLINLLSLVYLAIFSLFIFSGILEENFKMNMLYLFLVCIFSDVGGLIFGKIFKGKKLTKISPNKTISGSVGSLLIIVLAPLFYFLLDNNLSNLFHLIIISISYHFLSVRRFIYLIVKKKSKSKRY